MYELQSITVAGQVSACPCGLLRSRTAATPHRIRPRGFFAPASPPPFGLQPLAASSRTQHPRSQLHISHDPVIDTVKTITIQINVIAITRVSITIGLSSPASLRINHHRHLLSVLMNTADIENNFNNVQHLHIYES